MRGLRTIWTGMRGWFGSRVLPLKPIQSQTAGNGIKVRMPLWTQGFTVSKGSHPEESMNELADMLNKERGVASEHFQNEQDVVRRLYKVIQAIGKASDITIYASVAALYYGTVQKIRDKKLIAELIVPCVESKAEYIDARSLAQALWSLAHDKDYLQHPVIEKLLALLLQKDFCSDSAAVQSERLNPYLYRPSTKASRIGKVGTVMV